MIQKMFAIRDTKAQAFLQPFFSSAAGAALRALGDAVNDGKSPIALHPEDYVLYEVASFDDQTAEIVPISPIKLLAMAADFAPVTPKIPNYVHKDMAATDSDMTRELDKELLNGKK